QDRSSASAVHRPHPARLPEPVICLSIKKPASAGFLMLPRQVAHEIVGAPPSVRTGRASFAPGAGAPTGGAGAAHAIAGAPPSGRTDYSARSRLLPPAQYLYCLLGAVATHLGIGHEPGTHTGRCVFPVHGRSRGVWRQ